MSVTEQRCPCGSRLLHVKHLNEAWAGIGQPKGQSRTASLLETATHITIGFVIALWLTKELFPQLSYTDNARITAIFTAVSLVRGFVIRRIFNYFTVQ
jgi:hypothetical protein